MQNNRTKKSIVNIISTVGYQLFTIVSNFVSRTIFIHVLGRGYLGINSLFTNVLSVLSLAELGVGSAMIYSMYEPLASDNHEKLASLVQYYRVVYRRISCIIFGAGIATLPFLNFIVNLQRPIKYIHLYYFLFLLNTVVSYLCTYKTSILTADQKTYVLKITNMLFDILKICLQIFVLLVLRNYLSYLLVQIACSISYNICSAHISSKTYPFINEPVPSLKNDEKKGIWRNIQDMFAYKVGGVILNNTDQLLISIIVSTEVVGLYSNYYTPVHAFAGITSGFFIAIQSSVGNLAVDSDQKRQFFIFKVLDMCSFWIYGLASICVTVLLQPFINLWLGNDYMLSQKLVYIMACNYYLTGVLYPIWCYRETVGLFKQTKYIMFLASGINIILSVIMGEVWGIEGILFATIVSRVTTNIWFEPLKLFHIYFHEKVYKYYLSQIVRAIILICCIIFINKLFAFINLPVTWVGLIVKGCVSLAISCGVMLVLTSKTEEFKYIKSIALKKCEVKLYNKLT